MARVYPMYSSSKGNSTFIGDRSSGVLIDCGVSCKRIVDGLSMCDIPISAVKAVFITHDHSDHTAGLAVLTKKYNIPIYSQDRTLQNLFGKNTLSDCAMCGVIGSDGVTLAGFSVNTFNTQHDTQQSCGYCVHTEDGKKISVCTDLGIITNEVRENIKGSDFVLIESNYDKDMLKNGSYPYYLKKRIASSNGHLSNDDCAVMVRELVAGGTRRIVLAHLSQENNSPSKALQCTLNALSEFERDKDYILDVAPVFANGKKYII